MTPESFSLTLVSYLYFQKAHKVSQGKNYDRTLVRQYSVHASGFLLCTLSLTFPRRCPQYTITTTTGTAGGALLDLSQLYFTATLQGCELETNSVRSRLGQSSVL